MCCGGAESALGSVARSSRYAQDDDTGEEGYSGVFYKDKNLKRTVISTKRSAWRNLVLPLNGIEMFFDLIETVKVPTKPVYVIARNEVPWQSQKGSGITRQ